MSSLAEFQLCPTCCTPSSTLVDMTPKVYIDLNLLGRSCCIEIDLKRFECRNCCCTFTESLSFASPYRHYTKRFEHEVYKCCQETTASYAGTKFGISDKTATQIYHRIAKEKQEHNPILPTEAIGIDEIAMHKGHKDFVVVISDLTNEQESILNRVLTASPALKACYDLKESFRQIFNSSDDKESGSKKLSAWILEVTRVDVFDY